MHVRITALCGLLEVVAAAAAAQPVLTESVITPAAIAEQAQLCQPGAAFPAPAEWDPGMALNQPVDATGGTPAIDQYRNGVKIATYSSFANQATCDYTGASIDNPKPAAATGCGPFTREYAMELKKDGDLFKVHPAIYSDPNIDEIYMGPVFGGVAANNITVQGIVAHNQRPVLQLVNGGPGNNTLSQSVVYVDQSSGFTMENINVAAGPGGSVAYNAGAVFDEAGANVTFRNLSIHGFGVTPANPLGGNGVITGAGTASGFVKFERVELAYNGGPGTSGNRHNAYIGEGVTAIFNHVWSHGASYGHEIKSRAEKTIVKNSYLEGVTGTPDYQGEAYLMDYSNGGELVFTGNILRKGASGPNSNGVSVYYAAEGIPDSRPLSIDIENNTFQALAQTFDGSHPLYPLAFFYPNQLPGDPGFPVASSAITIQNNVFAGYCPTGLAALDYRGLSLTTALSEVNLDYTLVPTAKYDGVSAEPVGDPPYSHVTRSGPPRVLQTVGAMD